MVDIAECCLCYILLVFHTYSINTEQAYSWFYSQNLSVSVHADVLLKYKHYSAYY